MISGFKFEFALDKVEITLSFSFKIKGEIMDFLRSFQWGVSRGYPVGYSLN